MSGQRERRAAAVLSGEAARRDAEPGQARSSSDRSVTATDSTESADASNGAEVPEPDSAASPEPPRPAPSFRPTPRPRPKPGSPTPAAQSSRDSGEASAPTGRSAGLVIANRYRLLTQVGADTSVHAEFWRARDTVLERDVAVTLLRASGEADESTRAAEMIKRALRWGRFEHVGCARLLDVMLGDHGGLPDDVLGLAVTEWVPGRSLAETVAAGLSRSGAALATLEPLVRAAQAAHAQGLVLGCAHPQRIRITPDGKARLAFALPNPETEPLDDVHGLGALLYTLLTGRWPLASTDGELAGLPPAARDLREVVVPPSVARPGVSVEVSALAQGALGIDGPRTQVLTAAGLAKVLGELLEVEGEAALLPPPNDGAPASPDEVWREDAAPAPEAPDRKRKLSLGMAGLGFGMIVLIVYIGLQLGSLLGLTGSSAPHITVTSPAPAATPTTGTGPTGSPNQAAPVNPSPEALVRPTTVRVYDPTGDPDNADRVSRAVDDDPNSSWSTYIYRRPFPALKPGVGVMVSFATPVQLSTLAITSPSPGSQIEIRSAPTPDAPFSQTVLIGSTTLSGQRTVVSLAGSQPVQNVLVWITKLGGGGDQNVTTINDLRFERATG